MANLRNGSTGDDVRRLQESLNQQGYNLAVDGIFGSNTQAAVRDYQSKNGLTVDGIAGNQTMTALANASASAQAAQSQPATSPAAQEPQSAPKLTGVSDYTHSKISGLENGYQPSERVQQAMAYLDEAQTNPVAEYQSQYDDQIAEVYNKIVGREPFSYSLTGDMLYQQYKQEAINNGRLAARDTMGQAAALNGGYGSSYGQAVGQQQYNEYLRSLNDVVPDLYNAAYNRWANEGDQLMTQYNMLRDQENQDYSRWNDEYNRQQAELANARNAFESERAFDYQTQAAEREYWQGRAALEQDDYWKNLAAQAQAAGSGRSGGGGGGGSKGKKPTKAMLEEAQRVVTDEGATRFAEKYSEYDLSDIVADWGKSGVWNGVTFRNDYTTTANDNDPVEREIKAQIAQKKADPSSSTLSLAQLEAELRALQQNRKYVTLDQYNNRY